MTQRSDPQIEAIVDALRDNKAVDITALDLRTLSDASDYFLIASGHSDTHVRALADHVTDAMKRINRSPHHVEGLSAGRWVLVDYVDVVVHIFHPTLREFYQLERLWVDAPVLATGTVG